MKKEFKKNRMRESHEIEDEENEEEEKNEEEVLLHLIFSDLHLHLFVWHLPVQWHFMKPWHPP